MRSILSAAAAIVIATTAAASAADLAPRYAKAPALAEVWSWTGFYVGGHFGGGWGTTESSITLGPINFPISQNDRSGFLGGGQVGYNFQSGWAVFGVQGDIAALNVEGTTPCLFGIASCTTKSNWLATVSGRIGGVVADRTLVYAKGGAAWLNSTHSATILGIVPLVDQDSTAQGWLVGFGIEHMFAKNWTGFVEYNYMDFDTKTETFNILLIPGATIPVNLTNKLSVAKAGVNFKF